jgi:outer membrane lipoprotein-sorting protein
MIPTKNFGRARLGIAIFVVAACVAYPDTIDEILAKHVNAMGGEAFLHSVSSTKTDSVVVLDEKQPGVRGTVYAKKPNKIRVEYEFPQARVIMAYNGDTGWSQAVLPNGEKKLPAILSEEKVRALLEDFDIFHDALLDSKENRISLAGQAQVMGRNAYVLELTLTNGLKETRYIDTRNYQELECVRHGEKDHLLYEIYFSDFKSWSGISMPSTVRVFCSGKFKVSTTIVAYNSAYPIEDSIFDLPK